MSREFWPLDIFDADDLREYYEERKADMLEEAVRYEEENDRSDYCADDLRAGEPSRG